MKLRVGAITLLTAVVGAGVLFLGAGGRMSSPATWSLDAEVIEGCSCRLFCPCFFSGPDKDFCKFNNAFRVKTGHYGGVKLDGLKFWVSGNLGDDFSDGEIEVLLLTFEPSATQAQIDAISAILGEIYPVHAKQVLGPERSSIEWVNGPTTAMARRANGKAEITLTYEKGDDGQSHVVIRNLKYMGAKQNRGFHLARSKHRATVGDETYSFNGTNGFYIEIISSGTVKAMTSQAR